MPDSLAMQAIYPGFRAAPAGATYQAPRINYGASGVSPAGGMNLTSLTGYIDNLQRQAATQANQARIPGAAGMEETSSANIGQELHGQVNADVLRLMQQQAAERGVTSGIDTSSPNANAAYLQALGLTSYGLQEQGQKDLSAAYARNPAAPLFDPATQLMTPYQSGELGIQQGQLSLEADRIAAENARTNQAVALRGAGGGGSPFQSDPSGTRSASTGATAENLLSTFAPDATEAWWNSIGFNPNTANSLRDTNEISAAMLGQPDLVGTAAPGGTTYFGSGTGFDYEDPLLGGAGVESGG